MAKAEVCKTSIHRFESDRRLNYQRLNPNCGVWAFFCFELISELLFRILKKLLGREVDWIPTQFAIRFRGPIPLLLPIPQRDESI